MALIRWDPTREITSLQSDVNRLFNTFFDTPGSEGSAARRWVPAMDLVESDDHFVLRADLPGVAENDVQIELQDNVLTVSGQRRAEHENRREGYHRVERSFGGFARSLTLPEGVDPDSVEASFDRGVLEVRIPKPAERKPRRISIAVGDSRPETIEATGREPAADTGAAQPAERGPAPAGA